MLSVSRVCSSSNKTSLSAKNTELVSSSSILNLGTCSDVARYWLIGDADEL